LSAQSKGTTSIGGYLPLERIDKSAQPFYKSRLYSNGRTCLRLALEALTPSILYVPRYICPVVIDVVNQFGAKISYFDLDRDFLPKEVPQLRKCELLLYVNYYGLCDGNIDTLESIYSEQLIVDNTMAFFSQPKSSVFFNSARKFIGVPDGGYLENLDLQRSPLLPSHATDYHLLMRACGLVREGYNYFLSNESAISSSQNFGSAKSEWLLENIDYASIRMKRRRNFQVLHDSLYKINLLDLQFSQNAVPLCYPFLPKRKFSRKELIDLGVFVPTYWPSTGMDCQFSADLSFRDVVPLPLDQNCSIENMEYVARLVRKLCI
jgi:hypothetical protein